MNSQVPLHFIESIFVLSPFITPLLSLGGQEISKGDHLFFLINALMLVVCHSKLYLLSQPAHAGEKARQKFMIKLLKVTASHFKQSKPTSALHYCANSTKLRRKCDSMSLVLQNPFRNHNIIFHYTGSTACSNIA